MLSPLRSHFLSFPKQHHPLGIRHSNLWHLSFNPSQFCLDRFYLMSFKNILLLLSSQTVQVITVQVSHYLFKELLQILQFLSQETLQHFSIFILETSISTIGNNQFAEKNDQISSQLTKFPWWFCSLLLSHEKPYQPSMTLPRTVFPPWYLFSLWNQPQPHLPREAFFGHFYVGRGPCLLFPTTLCKILWLAFIALHRRCLSVYSSTQWTLGSVAHGH